LRLTVIRYSCCINDDGPNIDDDEVETVATGKNTDDEVETVATGNKTMELNDTSPPVRYVTQRKTVHGSEKIPIGTIFGGDTEMDVLLSYEAAEEAHVFVHEYGKLSTTTTTTLPHSCPAVTIESIDNKITGKYAQVKSKKKDDGQCQANDVSDLSTWYMIKVNDETCASKIVDGDLVGLKNKYNGAYLSHQANMKVDVPDVNSVFSHWAVRCSCDTCSDCGSVKFVRDCGSADMPLDKLTCSEQECLQCGPVQLKLGHGDQEWKVTTV